MSLTFTEARDEILTLFKSAWDIGASGIPLYYWDVPHDPPSADDWARITVRHATGGNDAIGNRLFFRTGLVTIQLFTKYGEGLTQNDTLAKVAVEAFQGQHTAGGVWFRNVRLNEIGIDGKWFNSNVLADFEYNQVI